MEWRNTRNPFYRQTTSLCWLITCFPMLFFPLVCTGQIAEPVKRKASDDRRLEFFESKIRPVLIEHCYTCHSANADELGGNLLLDSRANMLKGGDLGPALQAGKPEKSLIISALKHDELEMPPDGKLDDSIIRNFQKWILDGAVDPRTSDHSAVKSTIDLEEGKKAWCFQPLIPSNLDRVANPIDHLISKKLGDSQLALSKPADPAVLLERVYFDLTGLPPKPEAIDQFLSGKVSYEQVIDGLLESPHFAEHWARHWLDVARYADSSGGGRILMFPDAWRYRDYVIQSFGKDKPFNRFAIEQISGDLLEFENQATANEAVTATGFLMLGAHNYELQDKELLRMEVVDEQINVVGRTFLGLTLSCARCHDHKFDPIRIEDYYALAGIFRSTKSLLPGNVSRFVTTQLRLPEQAQSRYDAYLKQKNSLEKALQEIRRKRTGQKNRFSAEFTPVGKIPGLILDENQAVQKGNWHKSRSIKPYVGEGYLHTSDPKASLTFRFTADRTAEFMVRAAYTANPNRTGRAIYRIQHAGIEKPVSVDQRTLPPLDSHFTLLGTYRLQKGEEIQIVLNGAKSGVTIADAVQLVTREQLTKFKKMSVRKAENAASKSAAEILAEQQKKMESQLAKLTQSAPTAPATVMSVREESNPSDFQVCIRGNVHKLGQKVSRHPPRVISDWSHFDRITGSGRRQFANWLTDTRNPLVSRVYVNRVWGWLFGKGIVESPDNFGRTGALPSHPELLDHLAAEFMKQDWSTKKLIRKIVLSKVYRQSSSPSATAKALDPKNRLLSYFPRKRLPAESIRDRMLALSGELDLTSFGPAIKPNTRKEFEYKYDSKRRSIYLPVFRNTLNDLFDVFDFPNPNLVAGKRNASTLPTQALFMMNSDFVVERSRVAAARIVSHSGNDFGKQLQLAYRLALSRSPSPAEKQLACEFFGVQSDNHHWDRVDNELKDRWRRFIHILISSVDFQNLK